VIERLKLKEEGPVQPVSLFAAVYSKFFLYIIFLRHIINISSPMFSSPAAILPYIFSLYTITTIKYHFCRRFVPGCPWTDVSQPRWVGARRNTKGNNKENRGSCCPAPRADALAVGVTSVRDGEKEPCSSAHPPARPPSRTRALDLPFIDVRRGPRCTMGGVAMCYRV
jgi:hypothetical protein